MKTPAFWSAPPGVLSALLSPLGEVYGAVTRRRLAGGSRWRAPVPVVCVGNLTAGGTGKTPVVLALLDRLTARGATPHALSRGYGGRERGPLRVDPARHTAADVGDEPLLLATAAPVWIGRHRIATATAAVSAGAGVLVMDDGLQNPGLAKDLTLVVVDGTVGFGNGRMIPAGPLRERIGDGLARADALVIVGPDRTGAAAHAHNLPVLAAALAPAPAAVSRLRGKPLLAFAGIGRPQKFFDTLSQADLMVAETHSFADHHPYRRHDVTALAARAAAIGAVLVTTAKDLARIPAEYRAGLPVGLEVLPVGLVWEVPAAVDALLDRMSLSG